MNKSIIAFVGYGAFGKQLEQLLIETESPYKDCDRIYFDDYAYADHILGAHPFADYTQSQYDDCLFIVALGYHHLMRKDKIIDELKTNGRRLLSVVHPSAVISPSSRIDEGVFIYSGCIIDMNVIIQSGCILYNGSTVAHDTELETSCFLAPRVTIAGCTHIKSRTFLGVGTCVANALTIGQDCQIGAGSLVQKNLPDSTSGIGNPFHILEGKKLIIK